MAVTAETLAAIRRLRWLITGSTDTVTDDLVRMWAVAWDEVVDAWRDIIDELKDPALPAWQRQQLLLQSERARKALEQTAQRLDDLAREAGVRITVDLPGVLAGQDGLLVDVVRSQFPASIDPSLSRMSAAQLDWIVARTSGQIESLLRPLSVDVVAVMRAELIRGVALGTNPKQVAREMLRRTKHGFDGGLRRAKTIARTEMLDATRRASQEWGLANSDVLLGWRWTCEFSSRTCPSCLAMHGQLFSLDEFGPDDHQNGRCTCTFVTKSWADLGIAGMDEPADMFPDARAWFDSQSEDVQREIMGRQRLADLRAGRLGWDDIPVRRANPGWRDSVVPAPVAGRRS